MARKHSTEIRIFFALLLCSGSSYSADADSGALEEITVTATKTGVTTLQSTPIAITAYTADDMAKRAIENIAGIVTNTPGIELSDLSGYSQLYIRGVGSNTVYVGSDPSSTVHIDGIYQARPLTYMTDFLDVDRVEVLKGPQGTLYGRNSVGGTINVISRPPSQNLNGEMQLTGGNYGEFGVQAYVSGPVGVSGVLGSIAVNRVKHDAYLDNVSTGGGLESEDHYGTRGQLLLPLGSDASVTLRGNYSHSSDTFGGAPKLLVRDGVPLDDSVIGDYQKVSTNRPAYSSFQLYGFSADLDLHLNKDTSLKSLTAYQDFNGRLGLDPDSSSLDILYTNERPIRQHQLSEELNLSGTFGAITYVLGAYYFHESDAEPLYVAIPAAGVSDINLGNVSDESEAVYGQGEYHFTPALSAVAGLRYTHEKRFFQQDNEYHAGAATDPAIQAASPVIGLPFFPPPFAISTSRADKAWTPKAGLNWQATDTVFAYLSTTRGFKSGGYDFGAPTAADATQGYNPEYLWAYELGVKSDWFAHRLRLNLDAFLYHYSDIQVEVFVPPANAITQNAATAKIKGLELEIAARPIAAIDLFANIAYLHARYDTFARAYVTGFGIFDASGKSLNNAPDWAYSAGATYTIGLPRDLGSVFVGSDYHWQDRIYFTAANNGVGSKLGYPQQQDPYGVVNARGGWRSANGRWSATVIGLNVTNRSYVTSTVNYGPGISGRPGNPKTVRAQLDYKF